jgi:hypothetical protein
MKAELARGPAPKPLTIRQAAAELGVSQRWLHGFLKTIDPCWLQAGARKLFDEEAMDAIKAAMREAAKSQRGEAA